LAIFDSISVCFDMPRSGGMTGTFLTGEAVARSPDNAAEPLDAAFDVSSAADRLTLKPGCQLDGHCKTALSTNRIPQSF